MAVVSEFSILNIFIVHNAGSIRYKSSFIVFRILLTFDILANTL